MSLELTTHSVSAVSSEQLKGAVQELGIEPPKSHEVVYAASVGSTERVLGAMAIEQDVHQEAWVVDEIVIDKNLTPEDRLEVEQALLETCSGKLGELLGVEVHIPAHFANGCTEILQQKGYKLNGDGKELVKKF